MSVFFTTSSQHSCVFCRCYVTSSLGIILVILNIPDDAIRPEREREREERERERREGGREGGREGREVGSGTCLLS